MSLQAIPPRQPSAARALLRFVHDRNPFYLLSALSMFVGFRVVLGALNTAPGDWPTLVRLIVTMQAYEAVLVALALYLIARRGLHRDGWILLGLESLFLVDLTNLNAELFTASPRVGAAVNVACFALAVVKVAAVVRVLRLRLSFGTAAYAAVQLAALLAMPGMFQLMRSTAAAVSPLQVYAAWWAVGGLLAVGAIVVRRDGRNAGHPFAALPVRLYVLVPLASLLVHLASENRVYWVHFDPANLAPVLLAGVVLVNRGRRHPLQLQASLALAAVAVFASVTPDEYRAALSTHVAGVAVSPLRVTLLIAGALAAALAVRHRSWPTAAAVAACGVLAALGTSVAEIVRRLVTAAEWAEAACLRLVPQTPLEWGYAAIVAAFVLLGVGAVVSLRPTRRDDLAPPPEPPFRDPPSVAAAHT